MKKRTTYKLLSMLLVFVLLLPSFSFVTFAGSPITESMGMDTEEPVEIFNPDEESDTSSEPESIEILNRRARNVKHFRHEDGTIEAIIYGYAVHRQDEDGNWQDIDNRLIDSANGNTTYYTTDDNRIRFTNTGVGQLTVTLDSKPYRITMGMLTNDLQSGELASDPSARPEIVVRNHPVRAEQVERMATDLSGDAQIELLKKIDNRTELCYRNIQDGIHLKYELEADDIKETIVVNEPQANYIYRFGLRLDGLTAILRDDGGIDLTDSETGETPYRIPAPFMVDANDEISYDVAYTLEQVGDGAYLLTVTADSTWIDARDRAFPVSIDPSVSTSVFADTYIEDNHPDTLHGSGTELWVGSTKYTYIRPENVIPTIPRKAIVNYAFLYGYYYYHSTVTSGTFELAEYRATQDWAEDLTWTKAKKLTNMGFNPYRCYDTVNLSGSAGAYYSSPKQFSLVMKDIVQYWADGYSNYGVVLKRTAGSLLHSIIVSSEGRTAYRPYLVISYTEPWIDNAVYRLKNAETGLYLTVGGGTAYWRAGASIQQNVRSTAEDKTAESRKQLFKIYRVRMDNGDYYYTVRLMTNSALSVSAPLTGSRAAVAKTISVTDSWSEINSTERWLIKRDGAYVTLYNGGYLTAPQNTTQGAAVSATSAKTNYSKWILERYTGGTIEGFFFVSDKITETVTVGEAHTWQGVMFSSVSQTNGPVVLSVENARFGELSCASIDSNGVLRAVNPGKVIIRGKFNRDVQNSQNFYQGIFYQWVMLPKCEMFLRNQTDTHQYLQVGDDYAPDFNKENAKIEGRKFIAGRHQKWEIEPIEGTPYYKIQNKASKKVLTVPDGKSTTENVQLIQTTYTDSENQQWEIDNVRTGRYIIRPRLSPENLCVATSDWDKQILQRRCVTDNGSYREEWNFEKLNERVITKDIIFYYDDGIVGTADFPTINDLTDFLQDTLSVYMENFNLRFNIKAVIKQKELNWDPDVCAATNKKDTCTSACGALQNCSTEHHKSGKRLVRTLKSDDPDIYVCRIISYLFCEFSESRGHVISEMRGCTDSIGGYSRDSIVTFYDKGDNRMNERREIILHELSHNLGGIHCTDSSCITYSKVNGSTEWCSEHRLTIANILY